ncbi:MAG: acetylglucosamine-6-sulfatase, partial [Verrucomicrobiia bacterium]
LLPLLNNPKAAIHDSLPLINVWGPKEVHSLSVVTKDWKYIFWNYAAGDFEETEELYHTEKDGLELENHAGNSDYHSQLVKMQKVYDSYITAWKTEGVDYNNYERFTTIFDRNAAWSKKQNLIVRKSRKK